jgi:hypothetical protein
VAGTHLKEETMNGTQRTLLALACCSPAVLGCAARESNPPPPAVAVSETSEPGSKSASALVTATATVVDIDQATRMVTLRKSDGELTTFRVDESARNLPQVRRGDEVTVTYYESLALRLEEKPGGKPSVEVTESSDRAALGEKPGGVIVRETKLTAAVTGVDRKKQTVTLKGPKGNSVTLKVEDPKQLQKVDVGEMVEATYREAVAVSVQKPTR